ncbi:MAG: zinc ribbon domain-containing protein [candidate division KSB1 bacterium]|nr:zinc ribbon domain-containing protein [candidate division KSB1 bacterium]MDZ7300746.1 zinc ribbon domain-containing protein [candidate division KSB1 bacterium]MDZ7309984.1 zinc ribbon domain-containing protein [candidate division KSB1 bacterium]
MIRSKKILATTLISCLLAMLIWPVAAQEIKPMEKFYCPYCGMTNLMTSKFCGACGARLPNPADPRVKTKMPMSSSGAFAVVSDSFETKNLYDDEIVQSYRRQGSVAGPVAGGLWAGAIGLFAGGLIGARIDEASSDGYEEWDGLAGLVIGAPIGEALLLPVGVHLANRRQGNLPLALFASIGIAGAGIGLAAAAEDGRILIAIPVAQLAACVAIERATSHSR